MIAAAPPTKRWTQLHHVQEHYDIMSSTARFILMRAGRRSGKTEISKRKLVESLAVAKPWGDPKYFYSAPTRLQAKAVAWEDLKALTPKSWLSCRPSETELKITTKFGSTLQIFGLDQPQRIEGSGYDGCVVDEMSDVKPTALRVSIFPALADRRGWFWGIGVPKRAGVGAVAFNQMFADALKTGKFPGTNDVIEAYAWASSSVLTEDQLAFFRNIMDKADFDEQFNAMIQSVGGTVFHSFGKQNIRPVQYDSTRPIIVGMDFNVDPMSWVLCHEIDGALCQFGELWKRNTNTVATLKYLATRYGNHDAGWMFYGDASSRARKTSASSSDYKHVLADQSFKHKRIAIPKANPSILDRLSACNALFESAGGVQRYFVDPSCEKTITDLGVRAFKEGTMTLDDGPMVGHITDALGYIVNVRYPIPFGRKRGNAGVSAH